MKLNQTQIAEVLGVSSSTIAGWRDKPGFPQPAEDGNALIYDSVKVIAWYIDREARQRVQANGSSGGGFFAALIALIGGRSALYKTGRILGDVNAVAKGKVGKRIARRAAGKVTGRGLGKLFRGR